jgi:hypothetical protein
MAIGSLEPSIPRGLELFCARLVEASPRVRYVTDYCEGTAVIPGKGPATRGNT